MNFVSEMRASKKTAAPPEVSQEEEEEPSPLEEVRTHIRTLLRRGNVEDREEFDEELEEILENEEIELDEDALRDLVSAEIALFAAEQSSWPAETDNDRLTFAFNELTESHITAREDFTCCKTCGTAEIWGEGDPATMRGYVFFHSQDTDNAVEGGQLYLAYGSEKESDVLGIGKEVVEVLNRHGLATEWSGEVTQRIKIQLDGWHKRSPWVMEAGDKEKHARLLF